MIFALLTVNHIFVRPIGSRPYSCFSFSSPPPPAIMLIINKTSVFPRFQHSNQNISYIVGKRTAPGFIRRQQIQRQRQIQRQIQQIQRQIQRQSSEDTRQYDILSSAQFSSLVQQLILVAQLSSRISRGSTLGSDMPSSLGLVAICRGICILLYRE